MSIILLLSLIALTTFAAYVFWVRPVLRQRPTFKEYYDKEDSFWSAFKAKASGMKQWITTIVTFIAGFVVTAYDTIVSLAQEVGFQWGNVQTISSKVPSWAWPIIGMFLIGLVQWFREISNKRVAQVLQDNGVDPAAAMIAPLAPTSPVKGN